MNHLWILVCLEGPFWAGFDLDVLDMFVKLEESTRQI